MINIILNGYNGKMGREIRKSVKENENFKIVCGVSAHTDGSEEDNCYNSISKCLEKADVVVDFSHFSTIPSLLDYCLSTNTPVVIATTAINDELLSKIKQAALKIPVFFSANMSLGINVMAKALKTVSPSLEEGFDMEIIEKHHNKKKDSPSGTAILLADSINDSLKEKKSYIYGRHGSGDECLRSQMGIHAVRGGTIPGEHTVVFAGEDEIIQITHTALSRKIFANGALNAAEFLVGKPSGFYTMEDLLG